MKDKHVKAYMKCAQAFAECSPATRAKVGAVIVKDNRIVSHDYNAQPDHINGPCELSDGTTDPRVRHAEKSALMGLLRAGISPEGATMYVTHSCCRLCAIDIVDAGITRVVYKDTYRDLTGVQYLMDNQVKVEKFGEVVETV